MNKFRRCRIVQVKVDLKICKLYCDDVNIELSIKVEQKFLQKKNCMKKLVDNY